MSSQTDNIIYNALADGSDVWLPEVGTLIVRHHAAQRISSRRMVPPYTEILFSREVRGVSVVEMIAGEAGVTMERATDIYHQWLNHASCAGRVSIDGVGEIRDDKFVTDKSFENMTNPGGRGQVRINPLTNWLLISFVALCLLFAVGVAAYTLYSERIFSDKMDKKALHKTENGLAVQTAGEVASTSEASPSADEEGSGRNIAETEQPQLSTSSDTESAEAAQSANAGSLPSQPADAPADEMPAIVAGNSYIVFGVYVELANAEEWRRRVNSRFGDTRSRIYRYGNRYMLALFEGTSRRECVRIAEELKERSSSFGEVWVYTSPNHQ